MRVWFSKIQAFDIFCLLFFQFLWTWLSKYTRKDMTDTMIHFRRQTPLTPCSDLFYLTCILFIQKSSSIMGLRLWQTQTWDIYWRGGGGAKNAFRVRSSNLSQALRHRIVLFNLMQRANSRRRLHCSLTTTTFDWITFWPFWKKPIVRCPYNTEGRGTIISLCSFCTSKFLRRAT